MKPNRKVLIITYYWPPSGGSGVQRWLKFVKYLPQFGWEPYVFTPLNPSFKIKDESLEQDVPQEAEIIRFPIWEPYDSFNRLSKLFGGGEQNKSVDFLSGKRESFFKRMSAWIRGNLIVPDPRVFWVKPSVKFLYEFLKDNHISLVITSGPPHSMHLIGYRLKKMNPGLKWVADFRDPWSEWGLLDSLKVSVTVRRMHQRLERRVLQAADVITTITPFYARQFGKLSQREVTLITNGFDEDDFRNVIIQQQDKFTIRHVGIVNEKCDPRSLIQALEQLMSFDPNFGNDVKLEFIGEVNSDFKNYVHSVPSVESISSFPGNVPHDRLLDMYGSSSLLVIVLVGYKDAEGYMPGKLFEYIATGLPVLGIGPEQGDAAALLSESGSGKMFSSDRLGEIKQYIFSVYKEWKRGAPFKRSVVLESPYSRRAVTGQLANLLERLR